MARANISFTLGQGGLGQPAQGTDFIRGLCLYGTAPGSFATTATQAVFSLSDAEAKGITLDYADGTKATATYVVTAAGATGDLVKMVVNEPAPNGTINTVVLGTYTVASGDTTVDLLGASLAAFINAGTYLHGYTAAFNSGTHTLTITARPGLGIALNTGTALVITITGTVTGTLTPFSGGAYSAKSLWHYHVSEFFRANPKGKLWINFTASPSATFAEAVTLQNAAQGECHVIGVYNTTARTASQAAADMTILEARVSDMFAAYCPAGIYYAPNIKAITDLSTLNNLQLLSNRSVEPCIGQDGNAVGANLFVTTGVSVSCIGHMLGTSSAAAPSQNIGEVGAFNATDAVELAVPAFSNGQLVSAVGSNLLDQLEGYRYTFLLTYTGYSGTFYNNDFTAIAQSNDYNRMSRTLVVYKAVRQAYIALLPLLKARIYLNADGTLTKTSIERYDSAIDPNLNAMKTDGDLSDYEIVINPVQNVLQTNKVSVTLELLPVGMDDFISVTIGFVQKIN